MLVLKNIIKQYSVGSAKVDALKGVSFAFRKSEFVSVLGPSGCGKTTLLNLIGGLDRCTSGEIYIDGKSTGDFTDADWDSYRNHSVGFVFQSYNLIPHQSVLANVELALTLSGVSKSERRSRSIKVLEQVGLADQLYKKPNQLSGGQMQRVAIARALVNDPEILLADEPTGALDSETSLSVMELLSEVARDRLVIMVTHNPELAEQYSSRIIRLLDGRILSDSDPCDVPPPADKKARYGRTSMSFLTALMLSMKNLMTKKGRTFMTAFAGSIGIIGIALILSLSTGVRSYIASVEEDTLSSYPLLIEENTIDASKLLTSFMSSAEDAAAPEDTSRIYSNDLMGSMMTAMLSGIAQNDLASFKTYLEDEKNGAKDLITDIKYTYPATLSIWRDSDFGLMRANPSQVFNSFGEYMQANPAVSAYGNYSNVFEELISDENVLDSRYELLSGRLPQSREELVLIVDENHRVSDYFLYSVGIKDPSELKTIIENAVQGITAEPVQMSFSFDELMSLSFTLLPDACLYEEQNGVYKNRAGDESFTRAALANGLELKVVGIVCPSSDGAATNASGSLGYIAALTEYLVDAVNASPAVAAQRAQTETDIFTGTPFGGTSAPDLSSLTDEQKAQLMQLPEDQRNQVLAQYSAANAATFEGNMRALGASDRGSPATISIYAKNFEAKEALIALIEKYNAQAGEGKEIQYTDYVGLIMSSVTTIINAISYILIAFVAISLVVSSIMIGIITYISVLERTREIGILRAIGARKRDISRVFNAETVILGFVAGALGIGFTLLLNIPINLIIEHLTGIAGVAQLPVAGAVILVAISVLLTLVAGLIPSKVAANKDPVVALRTE